MLAASPVISIGVAPNAFIVRPNLSAFTELCPELIAWCSFTVCIRWNEGESFKLVDTLLFPPGADEAIALPAATNDYLVATVALMLLGCLYALEDPSRAVLFVVVQWLVVYPL